MSIFTDYLPSKVPYLEGTVGIFDLRPFYAALLGKQLLAKSKVFHKDVLFTPEYEPEKLKDELGKDFQC